MPTKHLFIRNNHLTKSPLRSSFLLFGIKPQTTCRTEVYFQFFCISAFLVKNLLKKLLRVRSIYTNKLPTWGILSNKQVKIFSLFALQTKIRKETVVVHGHQLKTHTPHIYSYHVFV